MMAVDLTGAILKLWVKIVTPMVTLVNVFI